MTRGRKTKRGFSLASRHKRRGRRPFGKRPGAAGAGQRQEVSEEGILGLVYGAGRPLSFTEILAGLNLAKKYKKAVTALVAGLCKRKKLICHADKTYTVGEDGDLVEARLIVHPRGFGFAEVVDVSSKWAGDKDIFIPPGETATALHGDLVLVRITKARRGRAEGRVIRVLDRKASQLVGTYVAGGTTGMVMPEDERYPFHIVIHKEDSRGAQNGQAVVAEIRSYIAGRNPAGRIVEVLGDPDDLLVQTEIAIRKFELPHVFDERVMAEVEGLDPAITPSPDRLDLRGIAHVTIDGETARDFDDAVAIEKTSQGFRLYVSIADVSHYVRPGSAVDIEAYRRGTSVYFPNKVVPMLPERLSNNLCSLVPHEDRLTFTAILDFDRTGKRLAKKFGKSIIRSRHRLTYTKVKAMLVDKDRTLRKEYSDVVEDLGRMADLAAGLEARRMERGSIGFEIPEARIVIGDDGKVVAIERLERNLAHKLIEEFMLAANEAVAKTFAERHLDGLFRIHETPDPVKVDEFAEFARGMGLKLPPGGGSPQWFGKVLALVAGTPKEYIVSTLLLRAMKQACYAAENVGHFGLAAHFYTHFTSPIRRYPDLMVHRTLAKFLAGGKQTSGEKIARSPTTEEAGVFLSKRERLAVDAEREVVERLTVRFMEDKVGEIFEAVISGATSFGLFVELVEVFVSGAVPITELRDDYYELDEKHHRLMGRGSAKVYQLGDLVRVRLASVDKQRRRLNFVIVG